MSEIHRNRTSGPPLFQDGARQWSVFATKRFPPSLSRPLADETIETWVEKSAVAPQSRSKTTAFNRPLGEGYSAMTVFAQRSGRRKTKSAIAPIKNTNSAPSPTRTFFHRGGAKMRSEERAQLFAIRVQAVVMPSKFNLPLVHMFDFAYRFPKK